MIYQLQTSISPLAVVLVWVLTLSTVHAQRPWSQTKMKRGQARQAKRIETIKFAHTEPQHGEDPQVMQLTLERAKLLATEQSNVLVLASLQLKQDRHARQAAHTDYFPKLLASGAYFHFDRDLGTVLTTRQRPVLGVPAQSVAVPIIFQDAPFAALVVAQPITQLLKVRQAVNIAAADERIAAAGYEKARRAIVKGVEQLYFGLWAAQQIRDGAAVAVKAAEKYVAAANTPDARIALLQAKQARFAAANQASEYTAQMNSLLHFPLCSELELSEPPPLVSAVTCESEAINLALMSSPDVYEARQNVAKAMAALNLAKSDFVPNVTLLGMGVTQDSTDLIQEQFSGVGIQASHTLFEWGKKKFTLQQRQATLALAKRNLLQTRDTARLDALKAFRKFQQDGQAVEYARQMLKWRKEALEGAKDPALLKQAIQARMEAEVAYIQAQAQHRVSYADLMSLTGEVGHLTVE